MTRNQNKESGLSSGEKRRRTIETQEQREVAVAKIAVIRKRLQRFEEQPPNQMNLSTLNAEILTRFIAENKAIVRLIRTGKSQEARGFIYQLIEKLVTASKNSNDGQINSHINKWTNELFRYFEEIANDKD